MAVYKSPYDKEKLIGFVKKHWSEGFSWRELAMLYNTEYREDIEVTAQYLYITARYEVPQKQYKCKHCSKHCPKK